MDDALPISADLPRIVELARSGAVVVAAPPGSGKTTLVPPALLDDLSDQASSVILVQPRRLAARAVARRIAFLRKEELGRGVGYQVRFDRVAGRDTRLLVVTTGVLLRKLLLDLMLPEAGVVVLDEFHERTLEMDLALGFLIRLQQTVRPDLRIAVMSATLDTSTVARHLGNCGIVRSEGRMFPVDIHYQSRRDQRPLPDQVAATLPIAFRETSGHVLIFLPGVGEILKCRDALSPMAARDNLELLTLYGDLPAEQQDRVLAESHHRKVILSTNVAETSLTIDGVTAVIDSGTARQLTVSPSTGLPKLELVRISRASADQRTGRAGRIAAGHCWRLWEKTSHNARPAEHPPEILRGDFAEPLLQLLQCGERDVDSFPWLDPPPTNSVHSARRLLLLLGAIDSQDRVTEVGQQLAQLPAHPRLGRLILAGAQQGVLREASIAAALLSERDPFCAAERNSSGPRDRGAVRSRSDLVDRVLALQAFHAGNSQPDSELECHAGAARNVLRTADQLFRMSDFPRSERAADPATGLMRSLLAAFPDRLAKLRPGAQDRAVMVGGRGVRIDSESRVRGEELFLCLELNDRGGEARARLVSAVDRDWLDDRLMRRGDELFFNPTKGQIEARRRTYWEDLLLEETPTAIQDEFEAALLLSRYARQSLSRILPAHDDPAEQFRTRVRWLDAAMPELKLASLDDSDIERLLPTICHGLRSIHELRHVRWLEHFQAAVGLERLAEVNRQAPPALTVPSGSRIALKYEIGKPPVLAVRIQEIFGWRESPTVAGGRVKVLLHLLGPNYRPQQITDDLSSFWSHTYRQIRKELRRRYPKHAWPEDPLAAVASRSGLSN